MNKKDKQQIISEVLKVLTDRDIRREYSRITGERFTNKIKFSNSLKPLLLEETIPVRKKNKPWTLTDNPLINKLRDLWVN